MVTIMVMPLLHRSFHEAHMLNLEQLLQLQQPPEPFAPGSTLFWDDPHISAQMLAAHLDPATAAASRPPDTIDRSVAWIIDTLDLQAGATILDLGCGPGLYAARLAERGMRVTGVDYSRRSIDYARHAARAQQLAITYHYQNYLTFSETDAYDVALLIYGDYCVLALPQRRQLLQNIHRALRAGGHMVLDVSTRAHRARHGRQKGWSVANGGFWRPGLHLVLEQGFDYPAELIYLDQYLVLDPDKTLTVYRNWFQDYTPERITAELTAGGFRVVSLCGDLAGAPLSEASEWIGVVAQRTPE
jgi:SAM-dependent methyltransferase